jgi:hypothetical protein
MTYYTKTEAGEFTEIDSDKMFKERHDRWVEKETKQVRETAEAAIREELTPTITTEVETRIKGEFETKLEEATSTATKLETQLRQKTIAAEYGFKAGTEKYLGDGDEASMRKEADTLKTSFAAGSGKPDRDTNTQVSKTQEKTGIKVLV